MTLNGRSTSTTNRPAVIAHRGASHLAPENTMVAFAAAVEAGADGIELDVHLSADGVPVVIHNAGVEGTTSGTGQVSNLTLAQLQALDAGAHFSPAYAGERIPTLEQVFAVFGNRLTTAGDRVRINVEIKPQPLGVTGLELAVVELIHDFGLEDTVWVSSFKPYSLASVHRLAPEIGCGLLYSPLTLSALFLAPVTPFEAFHPHVSLVRPWFVRLAHKLDRRVIVWTVDCPARVRDLVRWGVDGIITNEPGQIRAGFSLSRGSGEPEE
ncbi:MAG: glycerophosphodiester phosphodiesterase [Anaerolineae bacterium]